jgi:molecular chaperone GrpE
MIRKKKDEKDNRIPVQFVDDEPRPPDEANVDSVDETSLSPDTERASSAGTSEEVQRESDDAIERGTSAGTAPNAHSDAGSDEETDGSSESDSPAISIEDPDPAQANDPTAGPMLAELIATRAELRRVETERNDLLERLARRQADFENYRKRVERERGETYQRMVGDVVSKLLPVMDNMRRALQAESILEKNESAEFRHFLRGVELIYKQLNDALQELGVEPVPAVGQPFDPHLHEAVATEHSDEYEPDTVIQELLRGYRLGEKLLRPAMVKVSTKQ